uniref:ATP synthase F0 subunit 8 n=1 Tax=Lasioderma redtenbacheri TaxID=1587376 RepID=A0A343C326_9COLE|nr:ATP synthase F0 subunit 8 [Lasioderma redtenbacheri]
MPQMSPLLWLVLFIMFSVIFVICLINIYFNFNYSVIVKGSEKKSLLINWKW